VTAFCLPDLGEGLEEATIVRWLVEVGDEVQVNDDLCVVETAKAEVTLPSPCGGRIVARNGEGGQTVPVGWLLVEISAPQGGAEPMLVGYGPGHTAARPPPRQSGLRRPVGVDRRDRGAEVDDVLAAPAARVAARDLGIDIRDLGPGTGPNGAITTDDVEKAGLPGVSEVVPVSGTRARTAERTARAHATIPSASASVWVDCTAMRRGPDPTPRRGEHGDARRHGPLAGVASAVVKALLRFPILNSRYVEDRDEIHVQARIDLAVAVAADRGLLVPVVKDAGRLGPSELAVALDRLVAAARAGQLAPADVAGGTFTITNYGALGLDDGVPIIGYPQAAILGIGAIAARPVVVDGSLAVRHTAKLTCVFDHRVCDGADVAAFLNAVRSDIEAPGPGEPA
jgi:2-oxoisovalerate dehydrogenase E2 component (dihydrolipoyl transacylase)